jgi:hypothetical protein
VGAIQVVTGLALFVGKVFIFAAVVAASFFYLDRVFNKELHGIVGPLVLIGLITWFTVTMFMDVYHMCVDTVFMCYLADEEAHDGVPKFASGNLKSFILEHGAIVPGTNGTTATAFAPVSPTAATAPKA